VAQRKCPKCQEFISGADRVCPYCEFELAPPPPPIAHPNQGRALPQMVPDAHSTTFILMLMNVGMFAASLAYAGPQAMSMDGFDGNELTTLGAMRADYMFYRAEWWRLITAGFLHGNIMHIGMNMLGLYQLGNEVEEVFQTPRYLTIYIVSTITGFYCSFFFGNFLSVGASAGLFGLLGALIAYGVVQRSTLGQAIKQYYTRLAVYMLLMSFLLSGAVGGRTDNAAHIGGLAGGFLTAYAAGLPRPVANWRERLWQGVCWFTLALVALSYVTWARRYVL
jgi:rhomboid protease GluP